MMLDNGDIEVLKSLCLIQREVISNIIGFGMQFHSFKRRFLKFLVVFSSSDVHGYHLTR